jgi:hypothetical protein
MKDQHDDSKHFAAFYLTFDGSHRWLACLGRGLNTMDLVPGSGMACNAIQLLPIFANNVYDNVSSGHSS